MSLGLILVIILVIFLLGGFSGRFGGTDTALVTAASVGIATFRKWLTEQGCHFDTLQEQRGEAR